MEQNFTNFPHVFINILSMYTGKGSYVTRQPKAPVNMCLLKKDLSVSITVSMILHNFTFHLPMTSVTSTKYLQ